MALEQDYDKFGTTFSGSYFVVNSITFSKGLHSPTHDADIVNNSHAQVLVYASKSVREADGEPIDTIGVDLVIENKSNSKSAVEQVYTHMKSLDKYKNAKDV